MAQRKRSGFGTGGGSGFTPITPGSRRSGGISSGASASSGSGFTPLTPGGKLAAAQAGTLYSQQQQWTAAGYGPTGDYASKAQSWLQRKINRRYMGGGLDQGYTSLIGYYLRSRQRAGLEQISPQPTTAKEVVRWLVQHPGDQDSRSNRDAIFVLIFDKAAREAGAAGDSSSEDTLRDAAAKARRMLRSKRRARPQSLPAELQQYSNQYADEDGYSYDDNDLQGIVADAHANFQAASVPMKAAVVLGVAYALKHFKIL